MLAAKVIKSLHHGGTHPLSIVSALALMTGKSRESG